MKATELRIGNLTQDSKGNLLKVIGLTDDNISYYVVDRSKFPLEVGWQAEPIPLTEEWLVKFGFEEYSKHINGDFELCIKSDKPSHHIVVRITRSNFSVFNHSECDFTQIQFINRVKHVHQLQNLVHALTGEELTIK